MFGDVAFAQAPFASLGGNTFSVSVSESSSVVDSIDTLFTAGGLIDENVLATTSQSVLTSFVATNAETASAGDVFDTLNNTFNVTIPETAIGVDTLVGQVDFV